MNRVGHFEIHAEDPERAAAFYSSLFGWDIKNWGGPVEYWLVTTGPDGTPGINGGILRRRGPAPADGAPVNAYVCTIIVGNLDAILNGVPEKGGVIAVPKMPVPGIGWLAYFKDTEGNIFGAMQGDPAAA